MHGFNPEDLAGWTRGIWHEARVPESICGFCFDARQLKPGECFVALSGGARDGHDFVAQARELGASAALVEHSLASALPQLVVADTLAAMGAIGANVRAEFVKPVVGITGSCGKTSTKEMLRALLGSERTHATAGNWNNRIGVPMTLFGLDGVRHDFAVIEAGINQTGEMADLGAMIEADLTIITNVESAHLELLGSLKNVALEKAQLVACSKPDAPMILTADAFKYAAFAQFSARALVLAAEGEAVSPQPARVIRYRLEAADGGRTWLHLMDGDEARFRLTSPSQGICANAALAIIAARELGVSEADIRARIEAWAPSSTRGQIEWYGAQIFYIDCYNANPASMADALAAFGRAVPQDVDRCYILGAMNELGTEAARLHQQIGEVLNLRPNDRAFFVGPPALTAAYLAGAQAAGVGVSQLGVATDVEKIKSSVADFKGALFLKGSRAYALEQLLPEGAAVSTVPRP